METTVESIREELRGGVFAFGFEASHCDVALSVAPNKELNREVAKSSRLGGQALLIFGVNAGLIPKEEREDWLKYLEGKPITDLPIVKAWITKESTHA